jgi:HrpA-like RNA helicase
VQVLGSALDAPPAKQIDAALQTLKELGATDEAQRLTPLGQKLCQLHIEPRLGKMLVCLCHVFACVLAAECVLLL